MFEGAWEKPHEAPQVLPYFEAYARSHANIDLFYRTIRSADDIRSYCSRIPRDSNAFVYIACHGEKGELIPCDRRNKYDEADIVAAISRHREGAIGFLHFGCCEFVPPEDRSGHHQRLLEASGARWVSGYAKEIDWLPSTLLDLAFVSEVFVPTATNGETLSTLARKFFSAYAQLARTLCFSGMLHARAKRLFPERLRL